MTVISKENCPHKVWTYWGPFESDIFNSGRLLQNFIRLISIVLKKLKKRSLAHWEVMIKQNVQRSFFPFVALVAILFGIAEPIVLQYQNLRRIQGAYYHL